MFNRNRNFQKVDPRTVAPSRHVLFIRNLPNSVGLDRIRSFFAKESGSDCNIEFSSVTDDRRFVSVAMRFESNSTAKDILAKYNGKRVFEHIIYITWFKDLKRARDERMQASARGGGGGGGSHGGGTGVTRTFTNRREGDRSWSSNKRSQNPNYDNRSRHTNSRSRQYSDDEQNGGRKGRAGSSRSKSRSRSYSRYSSDAPRAYRSGSESDDGRRRHEGDDDGSLSPASMKGSPSANITSPLLSDEKKSSKRRLKYSRRSSSERSVPQHRNVKEGKLHEQPNGAIKRPRHDDFASRNSQDGEGNFAVTKYSDRHESPDSRSSLYGHDRPNSSEAVAQARNKSTAGTRAGDSAPQDRIKKRKVEIEQTYKKDCETFSTVTKLLISKDRDLEERLLTSLKDILRELGQQCIQELRLYINKVMDKGGVTEA